MPRSKKPSPASNNSKILLGGALLAGALAAPPALMYADSLNSPSDNTQADLETELEMQHSPDGIRKVYEVMFSGYHDVEVGLWVRSYPPLYLIRRPDGDALGEWYYKMSFLGNSNHLVVGESVNGSDLINLKDLTVVSTHKHGYDIREDGSIIAKMGASEEIVHESDLDKLFKEKRDKVEKIIQIDKLAEDFGLRMEEGNGGAIYLFDDDKRKRVAVYPDMHILSSEQGLLVGEARGAMNDLIDLRSGSVIAKGYHDYEVEGGKVFGGLGSSREEIKRD